MRMMKKAAFLETFFISCLFISSKSYAESGEVCPAPPACAPCGYMATLANTPSDAIGVNPLVNYTATAETIRCRGYFSGFYLGAAYGLGNINYHLEIAGNSPYQLDNDSRSYFATVFNGGFNLVLDCFFLGAELGYNYRSRVNPISYYDVVDFLDTSSVFEDPPDPPEVIAGVTTAPCKIRLDINSQHAVTADLLPGFVYSRFLMHLRLGVEQANYSWQRRVCFPSATLSNVTENLVVVEGVDFVDTQHKSITGYRLGAGIGIAAGPHVSFHLNYIHTFSEKMTFTQDVSAIAANLPEVIALAPNVTTVSLSELAANTVIEPQRDEVTFGVKFRF